MYIERTQKNNYMKGTTAQKKNKNSGYNKKEKQSKTNIQNLSFDENNKKNKRKRHLSENKQRYDDMQLQNIEENFETRHH